MILTIDEIAEIRAHHASGAKQIALAQAYGVTPHTIRQVTHNPNYRPRQRVVWTKQHRQKHREIKVAQRNVGINTKITPDDVQDIKRRLAKGEVAVKIAEMYGISESAISLIKKGKRWKDVEAMITHEHTLLYDEVHTLMDLLSAEILTLQQQPDMAAYVDYLTLLKGRVMWMYIEMLPGQEAVCTIRERQG